MLDDALYIPGAEGVRLEDLHRFTDLCPRHRYSFAATVQRLLLELKKRPPRDYCDCVTKGPRRSSKQHRRRSRSAAPAGFAASPIVSTSEKTRRGDDGEREPPLDPSILWAYELNHLVTAYKWIIKNRDKSYARCSSTVLVYQLRRSRTLPPGLYVYVKRSPHVDCCLERPICVIDQFAGQQETRVDLPECVFIDLFPGRDNYSAMYFVSRTLLSGLDCVEYSNRAFGELSAMSFVDYKSPGHNVTTCKHHQVAVRNKSSYIMDLRWNSFDTKTDCLDAIPKMKGLKALIWSNHSEHNQDIETTVLSWLNGYTNQLPDDVTMVDCTNERNGVRYILLDMVDYKGRLPRAPAVGSSVFMRLSFTGDRNLANQTIGTLPRNVARMGSPSDNNDDSTDGQSWYALPPSLGYNNPTPFSYGTCTGSKWHHHREDYAQLVEWTRSQKGGDCSDLAVQYTLYYHEAKCEYRMMLTHIVNDSQPNYMFRL